jgi:hypothetical protein
MWVSSLVLLAMALDAVWLVCQSVTAACSWPLDMVVDEGPERSKKNRRMTTTRSAPSIQEKGRRVLRIRASL